jgi:capsular polysaccharide biosynthesis protein
MNFNFDKNLKILDRSDKNFNWINFSNKYIKSLLNTCSSCILNHATPFQREYQDVIYTPYVRVKHDERYGCLYDRDGKRIEHSCLKQDSKYLVKDAVNYSDTTNIDVFEGKAIYLGILLGHYGHFLLESISRWWSLIDRSNSFDYYLFHLSGRNILEKPWIQEFLSLAGIDKKRIIYFDKPTRIKSVIVPEASLQIGSYIFKQYQDTCSRLTNSLDLNNIQQTDRPLYFSRRLLNRGARKIAGEELLEELLLKNGLHVVHPQFLSIEEQIYLINRHKHILGIVGSALHTLVFSLSPKTVTYIASENNLPPSYIMLDKLCQNQSTYVNSYSPLQKNESNNNLIFGDRQTLFNREYILDLEVISQYLNQAGYIKLGSVNTVGNF